jgi:hypothetical protein
MWLSHHHQKLKQIPKATVIVPPPNETLNRKITLATEGLLQSFAKTS